MTPEEYNDMQIRGGELTDEHVLKLAKSSMRGLSECVYDWQERHGLKTDKKAGNETRQSIDAPIQEQAEAGLAETALAIAISEIGNGEIGANNRGPDIERWLEGDGTGRPHDTSLETGMGWLWCAVFVSYCFMRAAEQLGVALPFETSRGAKHLGTLMLGGRKVVRVSPDDARPGDVFVIKRTGGHHVGFVEKQIGDGVCGTVEGNVGKYPSKVKRLQRDLHNSGLLFVLRCVA